MFRKLELADDLGPQQRHDVGEHREAEPGDDLLGEGCAAEEVTTLEHQDLEPGSGEVGRVHQPVVAAADHDRVVPLRHSDPPPVTGGARPPAWARSARAPMLVAAPKPHQRALDCRSSGRERFAHALA